MHIVRDIDDPYLMEKCSPDIIQVAQQSEQTSFELVVPNLEMSNGNKTVNVAIHFSTAFEISEHSSSPH